tara:strand:- start:225 stop:524 length:300 start_codon:yes stop_codon:yes gene_type:complete
MSAASIPLVPQSASAAQLTRFKEAVDRYAKVRSDYAGLCAVIAMQIGAPEPFQRERLVQLSKEHFDAGEQVKALAMTLCSDNILNRCIAVIDDGVGGWM